MANPGSRRAYFTLSYALLGALNDAAASKGLSQAGFVRQALTAAVRADGFEPKPKPVVDVDELAEAPRGPAKRLTAEDILTLDSAMTKAGEPLHVMLREEIDADRAELEKALIIARGRLAE